MGAVRRRLPVALVQAQMFLSDRPQSRASTSRRSAGDDSTSSTSQPRRSRRSRVPPMPSVESARSGMPRGAAADPGSRAPVAFDNAQGGARLNATTGRVDWSVSAFRGFEPFPCSTRGRRCWAAADRRHPSALHDDWRRFRDRSWGMECEARSRPSWTTVSRPPAPLCRGRRWTWVGVDRRAGDYRISGTVLFHHEAFGADFG